MKKLLAFLFVIGFLAAACWGGWRFYYRAPARVVARMESVADAQPDLDAHLERYAGAMDAIAVPFRALSAVGVVVARVDGLRSMEVEVLDRSVQPWGQVVERVPGSEIADAAIEAAMDVANISSAIMGFCNDVSHAADAFDTAWTAARTEPTDESIAAAAEAARTLANTLLLLRDGVEPSTTAFDGAARQAEALRTWLDGVTAEGVQEGIVLSGMKAAADAMHLAVLGPRDSLVGLTERIDDDIATLRELARVADGIPPNAPLWLRALGGTP